MHTVLRAAAEKVEYVSVSADDFHHFHLLNQVRNVTVAAVVCNKTKRQKIHVTPVQPSRDDTLVVYI